MKQKLCLLVQYIFHLVSNEYHFTSISHPPSKNFSLPQSNPTFLVYFCLWYFSYEAQKFTFEWRFLFCQFDLSFPSWLAQSFSLWFYRVLGQSPSCQVSPMWLFGSNLDFRVRRGSDISLDMTDSTRFFKVSR